MRVIVGTDQRFLRASDGSVWSNGMGSYNYWTRYLETFDEILVVARVKDDSQIPSDWVQVNGAQVETYRVPHYIGPRQYARHSFSIRAMIRAAVKPTDSLIVRAPGQIAQSLVSARNGAPYGVEVLGNPWDAFSPGAIVHPLRPLFRRYFDYQLKSICRGAASVAYVTGEVLQHRFPGGPTTRMFQVTDGVDEVRSRFVPPVLPSDTVIVFVGSLAQMYKAPDVLLQAISICNNQYALPLRLIMVGDGKHRPELEELARSLGIADQVEFTGELPSGVAIRDCLDRSHLFVLPSRAEGLPRALIEAMARGLPCIGAKVGGFPELLEPEELVPPGDATLLASKIREIVTDPDRMRRMSNRNLDVAAGYLNADRQEHRLEFHRALKMQTETWIVNGGKDS